MNECLVTRLKSSVNDDNLNIFGATSLKIDLLKNIKINI